MIRQSLLLILSFLGGSTKDDKGIKREAIIDTCPILAEAMPQKAKCGNTTCKRNSAILIKYQSRFPTIQLVHRMNPIEHRLFGPISKNWKVFRLDHWKLF